MKRLHAALAASFLLSSFTAPALAGQWQHKTNYAGLKDVSIYVPDTTTPRNPAKRGMVFVLHGCGQVNDQFVSSSGWPEAADAYGLVVVVPEAVYPVHPNQSYPNNECYDYGYDQRRDYPVIAQAAKTLRADASLNVDPNQVYIAGLSAGAVVSMDVACLNPDVFSGVGSAAGPAIGSNQAQAIFQDFNVSAKTIRDRCTQEAAGKTADLAKQVYAIISDDNNISYFQTNAYDGDKYAPIQYHPMIAEAMGGIFGATYTGEVVTVGTGRGLVGRPEERDYTATAKNWKDSAGRIRVSLITHDTLMHAWPSGPLTHPLDAACASPDGKPLSYYKDAAGNWDTNKLKTAPNGAIGCLYINADTLDFPMYLAKLWNDNNPKLGDVEPENVAPRVTVSATGDATGISVSGSAIDTDGQVSSTTLTLVRENGTSDAPISLTLQANGDFSRRLDGLAAGNYTVRVTATDDDNASTNATAPARVGSVQTNTPPTITLLGANPMTIDQGTSFTDPGATASDAEDGNLTAAIVANCSVNTATAGTYKCGYSVTDSAGAKASAERTVVVKPVQQTGCTDYSGLVSSHLVAGRVYRGGLWWAPAYYVTGSNEKLTGAYWWTNVTVHQNAGETGYHAGACQ